MKYIFIVLAVLFFNGCNSDDVDDYINNNTNNESNGNSDGNNGNGNGNGGSNNDTNTTSETTTSSSSETTTTNTSEITSSDTSEVTSSDTNSTESITFDYQLSKWFFVNDGVGKITKKWDKYVGASLSAPDATFINHSTSTESPVTNGVDFNSTIEDINNGTIRLIDDKVKLDYDGNETVEYNEYITYQDVVDNCRFTSDYVKVYSVGGYSYPHVRDVVCTWNDKTYVLKVSLNRGVVSYRNATDDIWYLSTITYHLLE